jgi:hypothetical protein
VRDEFPRESVPILDTVVVEGSGEDERVERFDYVG